MKKKYQGHLNLGGWPWRQEPELDQAGEVWNMFLILDLSWLSQDKELIVVTDVANCLTCGRLSWGFWTEDSESLGVRKSPGGMVISVWSEGSSQWGQAKVWQNLLDRKKEGAVNTAMERPTSKGENFFKPQASYLTFQSLPPWQRYPSDKQWKKNWVLQGSSFLNI